MTFINNLKIDRTVIEKQLLLWNTLLRKGKKLRLDICINYLADDNEPTLSRRGEKRGTTSVTKTMLAERDVQIDAEQSSGQYSPWRNVYRKLRCPGSPCDNYDGYCWQDPVGKKPYKLKTHHLRHLVGLVKKKKLEIELMMTFRMRFGNSSMQKSGSGLKGNTRLEGNRQLGHRLPH